MTFDEIEHVIGERLPESATRYRAWWSNNPRNSVITAAWLEAGFQTEQVDMVGRRLVFRRSKPAPNSSGSAEASTEEIHPIFGCLKGTVTLAPGVDLTEPADPEWGEVAYGDRTWNSDK
jgi:hypothetical protein